MANQSCESVSRVWRVVCFVYYMKKRAKEREMLRAKRGEMGQRRKSRGAGGGGGKC